MIFNGSDQNSKPMLDSLLSIPSSTSEENETYSERLDVPYKNLSEKYLLGIEKNSSRQYFEMYSARLEIMKPKIEEIAKIEWGDVKIKKLQDLVEGEVSVIVGTLFKRQELKPSILKELSEENQLMPQPVVEKFTSEDDDIILEDELQRIQLRGNIDIPELVTGIVCGVKGRVESGGKFEVEEMCFAGLPISRSISDVVDKDRFVLFVSGLELHNESASPLSLQLLIDYVSGHLAGPAEQSHVARVVRVVIAGNSMNGTKEDISLAEKVKQIKILDDLLAQLSMTCPVDVMPGEFDPANHVIPQQPFHRCLFQKASNCSLMQSVTNPYEFELGGRVVVGTSGQNVKDIGQCSLCEDPIRILEKVCEWGHVAPSAPDTLLSYPYYNAEPFIIDSCPDIIFAGNQKHFASKIIDGPSKSHLLLSIPKFRSTSTCVLVNLRNLEVQPLNFGTENA